MMNSPAPIQSSDGFLELAHLTALGSFPCPDPVSQTLPSSLLGALAELLRAASRGQGRIPLTDPRLRTLSKADVLQHPALFALEGAWLMLPRYAKALATVRQFFERRLHHSQSTFAAAAVHQALDAILPPETIRSKDGSVLFDNLHQRIAVAGLLEAHAGILTGGPGTGKTTTAAALLALRKRLQPTLQPSDVLVTAPTGKAACRIAEAIARASSKLAGLLEEERRFLKEIRAVTLHTALQWSRTPPEEGGPFKRGAQLPLEAKILLVDEASMVDLPLMAAVVTALSDSTALLLLGDSNQLKSVEVEGILSELTDRGALQDLPPSTVSLVAHRTGLSESSVQSAFRDALPLLPKSATPTNLAPLPSLTPLPALAFGLRHSHRAMHAPWILQLAEFFRPGSNCALADLRALLQNLPPNTVTWHERSRPKFKTAPCQSHWSAWANAAREWANPTQDPKNTALLNALQQLACFQLLCCTNHQVERANGEGIRSLQTHSLRPQGGLLPHGCPILIHTNHRPSDLSNGDVGIALGPSPGAPAELALFPSGSGSPRLLPLAQLPAHGPAFGLTIHKSQGSEWEHIVIELPTKPNSAMLTKNLLYTAITRSSRRIDLYGEPHVLEHLLQTR